MGARQGCSPCASSLPRFVAVGSMIGVTQDVDLLCLRRRGIVRIQVAVLNSEVFEECNTDSVTSDVVVKTKGYKLRFSLEKDDFIPRCFFSIPLFSGVSRKNRFPVNFRKFGFFSSENIQTKFEFKFILRQNI